MALRVPCRRAGGFTLLELTITAIIVALLAAIALPAYRQHVLRSHRALVRAALVDIAAKLEVEALRTGGYPANFDFYLRGDAGDTALLGEVEIGLDRRGQFTADGGGADDPDRVYSIRLESDGATYLLRAIARNGQTADTRCRELQVRSTVLRLALPDNDPVCWSG